MTGIQTRPTKAESLKIESNDGTNVKLCWNGANGNSSAIQYEIAWHCGDEVATMTTDSNECLLTNLKHGRIYTVSVTSVPKANPSKRGESSMIKINTAPPAPTGLEVTCARSSPDKAVLVRFSDEDTRPVPKAYEITVTDTSGNVVKTKKPDICLCMVGGLEPGTEYTVFVQALSERLRSQRSLLKTIETYPSQVQNLAKQRISTNTWCLSWDDVKSATSYEIIMKKESSNYIMNASSFPEYVFHNLERGSKYTMKVAAVNESGKGKFSSKIEIETDPEPPKNVLLKLDDENPKLLHVTFEEPNNKPSKYIITLIQNEHETDFRETREHSIALPVELSSTVKVSVHSVNEISTQRADEEPTSSSEAATQSESKKTPPTRQHIVKSEKVYSETITTRPEQVKTPEHVNRTGDSITIKWDEVRTATNYIMKIQEGINCVTYETEDNNYTLTNLHLDKKYFISVAAANKTGRGRYSEPFNFISAPQAAFDIEVKNFQPSPSTSIQVTFKHSGEGCMYQIVAQALSCGKDVLVDTDKCFAVVGGLQPGGTYSVYITATKDDLTSKKSDCSKLIQTYPAKIEKPEVAMEDGMLKFTWEAPDIKPKSYIAVLKTNHECSETLIPDGTSFAVTNITPSTTYCFTVAANNDAGCGEMSEEGKHVTAPAAPVNIKVKNPEISPETSLLVEFEDPDPSTKKYRIAACLERDPTEAVVAHVESTNKKALVTGLMPGQTYKVFVVAICGDLQSEKAYFI